MGYDETAGFFALVSVGPLTLGRRAYIARAALQPRHIPLIPHCSQLDESNMAERTTPEKQTRIDLQRARERSEVDVALVRDFVHGK